MSKVHKSSGSYRGYTWESHVDLADQLNVSHYHINNWLYRNKNKTINDYIDLHIRIHTNHTYKGITWTSYSDLSRTLNYNSGYVSNWLNKNPGKTVYDCIDYILSKRDSDK